MNLTRHYTFTVEYKNTEYGWCWTLTNTKKASCKQYQLNNPQKFPLGIFFYPSVFGLNFVEFCHFFTVKSKLPFSFELIKYNFHEKPLLFMKNLRKSKNFPKTQKYPRVQTFALRQHFATNPIENVILAPWWQF